MAKKKKLERNNFVKKKRTRDPKGYYFGDVTVAEINKTIVELGEQDESNEEVANLRYVLVSTMIGPLHMCQIRQALPTLSS